MDNLEKIIKDQIASSGPMDVGTFMGLALAHPQHGYYMTRDPLGARGDFTTSPEISQIFGEMIAVCVIEAWMRAGSPDAHLVELGPGRGTLMADILRAAKNAINFYERVKIHLVETSPVLKAAQEKTLAAYKPQWHERIDTLPADAPLIIVANEFFDALPIRQAVMTARGWRERVVGLEGESLKFGAGPKPPLVTPPPGKENDIFEYSPARDAVMQAIAQRFQKQGGMMIAIDYGHDIPRAIGDTFQAVRKHGYCDPLTHIGDADLTSHVDFARLAEIAKTQGCAVQGTVTQKAFLEAMGIHKRAADLIQHDAKNAHLKAGVERITDPSGMGTLFRALAVTAQVKFCSFHPLGF